MAEECSKRVAFQGLRQPVANSLQTAASVLKSDYVVLISIGIYLFSHLFLYYADIIIASPKTLILILLSIYVFFVFKKIPDSTVQMVLLATAAYISALKLFIFGETIASAFYYSFLYMLTPFLIIYVFTGLINTKKRLYLAIYLIAALMVLNCITAVGQSLGLSAFWSLRSLINQLPADISRPAGLASYSIDLAYQLVIFSPLAFPFVRSHILAWPVSALFVAASLFSMTRTAAAIITLLFMANMLIAYKAKWKTILALGIVSGLLFLILAAGTGLFSRLTTLNDPSARGRVSLALLGLRSIADYPMGLDGGGFLYRWQVEYGPHNQFINIAAFYGLPSLFLLCLLTYLIINLSWTETVRTYGTTSGLLNIGFISSIIGFVMNSLMHNAGFFNGNSEIYIIVALAISLRRIEKNGENFGRNVGV